jgi:hypothetical protein
MWIIHLSLNDNFFIDLLCGKHLFQCLDPHRLRYIPVFLIHITLDVYSTDLDVPVHAFTSIKQY